MQTLAEGSAAPDAHLRPGPAAAHATIGAIVCAVLLYLYVWGIHPYSFGGWPINSVILATLVFFAPIIALLWSMLTLFAPQTGGYVWMRRLIQLHALIALIALIVIVVSFPRIGWLPPLPYQWNIYSVIASLALPVDALVLWLAPRSKADRDAVHTYRRKQLLISGGAITALAIWSFANIGMMVAQAQFLAGGKPYCLQVDGGRGYYRQIQRLVQLNGLTMHTPVTNQGGTMNAQFLFHGVLAINTGSNIDWRNWSYLQQHFMSFDPSRYTSTRTASPDCEPRINFALGLPFW